MAQGEPRRSSGRCDGKHTGLPCSGHAGADGLPDGNAGGLELVQAVHVDAEIIGCDALAMEWVDATDLAKKMARRLRVEPVLGEEVLTGQQAKLVLVHLHHQSVLAPADGTVAHRELGKIGVDLEAHGSAMAASGIRLHRSSAHRVTS